MRLFNKLDDDFWHLKKVLTFANEKKKKKRKKAIGNGETKSCSYSKVHDCLFEMKKSDGKVLDYVPFVLERSMIAYLK